jgi:hypothetical protein
MTDPQQEANREQWRERYAAYASDFGVLLAPLRKDAIELAKEGGAWARLAVQYALIVNGGALAALPYLLAQGSAYRIDVKDASTAACWFAGGLLAAALCCLLAYLNAQFFSAAYFADWDGEFKNAVDRHFENEQLRNEVPAAMARGKRLRSHIGWTNWAGITLGIGSWVAFIKGALLLILFRSAPVLV